MSIKVTVEQNPSLGKDELERDMHQGFDKWSEDHARRFSSIGTLAYRPWLYRDQRIDKPKRPIYSPAYLPETAHIKLFKKAHAKAVGSAAVANWIIEGFKLTPAYPYNNSPSIAEFTRRNLDENISVGVASAHVDRLSDITDFTAGLSLALAEEHGRKYLDRFGVVVNKNMTRESFKVLGPARIPLPWLASIGVNVYWGMPDDAVGKHGINQETANYVNRLASRQILNDIKNRGIVLGIVPAGSGILRTPDEGPPEMFEIKDASATAALFSRLSGGVIPVNRSGDQIKFGSVISTARPDGITKSRWPAILTDQIMDAHAWQVSELTGAMVEFHKLTIPGAAGRISLKAL